jgi:hypothetical protein
MRRFIANGIAKTSVVSGKEGGTHQICVGIQKHIVSDSRAQGNFVIFLLLAIFSKDFPFFVVKMIPKTVSQG